MKIFLADLAHDYMENTPYVPLGIGYLASYSKELHGDQVSFQLFKSVDALLEAVEAEEPDLVGFSNYIWNASIAAFASNRIRAIFPDLPIIMGGPNIRSTPKDIANFLSDNPAIDVYVMYGGEKQVSDIIGHLLSAPTHERTGAALRAVQFDGCYSLHDGGNILGNEKRSEDKDLDFIPSPYQTGILDEFLTDGLIPILETNRGCPYSCTYCVWGVSGLNKLKRFSLERVFQELDYVARFGQRYSKIVFADANFGILERDVEISKRIRALYEETKSFSSVEMYWAKAAQDFMVDIGRILGHLTHTYIAFQSMDEKVLTAIKRKNIGVDRLLTLIGKLKGYTQSTRTDILVGLPEETYESHLESLDTVLSHGIDNIGGGEIRMLPGSEMEADSYREQYGIQTKYRLYEGFAGIYRGQLVYELEEGIRATNTMSEADMIRLRVVRAFFFISMSLGELRPIVSLLLHHGKQVMPFFSLLVEQGEDTPVFGNTISWLRDHAENEWFETPDDAASFLANTENREAFFSGNGFVKLNFGLLAYLIINPDQYEGLYEIVAKALNKMLPNLSEKVIDDFVSLCKRRNYLITYYDDDKALVKECVVEGETGKLLQEMGYYAEKNENSSTVRVPLKIDEVTASHLDEELNCLGSSPSIVGLSQLMGPYLGRFHLELVADLKTA